MADTYIKLELKRIFKFIAKWKGIKILEWHIGDEHIHLYLVIPPKYSVSYILCVLKAKSSNWLKKKTKRFPKRQSLGTGLTLSLPSASMNSLSVSIFKTKPTDR